MDGLRHFTGNANVVVNFFQSINCLFMQLRWLESHLRHSSTEQIAIVFVLVSLLGYYTFVCNGQTNPDSGYFCGDNGVSAMIAGAVLSIIGYFLYKRYKDSQSPSGPVDPSEQEKFLDASAPSYAQVEMGRVGSRVVRPTAYAVNV